MQLTLDRLGRTAAPFVAPFLVIVLMGGGSWGAREVRLAREAAAASRTAAARSDRAWLRATGAAYARVGHSITWPESLRVVSAGQGAVNGTRRLVLFLDDLGCNVCDDLEIEFVNDLERRQPGSTAIVVSALDARFAAALARVRSVRSTVYFDHGSAFKATNGIEWTPYLLALDERGTVVASHAPTPERQHMSGPFHDFAARYLLEPPEAAAGR